MKIPIWGPERPRGYRLCNSSCWDRSPTRSWVQDPGQTRWRINLWVANAQQMRSAYHRLLCSWHCCSDSCSELQPNLNPIPTFPSHEEWSMIITCYQVQIMRGESPKVLSVSHARRVATRVDPQRTLLFLLLRVTIWPLFIIFQ